MKKILLVIAALSILLLVLLVSCRKDTVYNFTNEPPVANAGEDQVVILPKDSVLLNGSNSKDPDGVIKAYQWTKLAGPDLYIIRNANSVNTIVGALQLGAYQFELEVADDKGAVDKDTVLITVNGGDGDGGNHAPVANAGPDQTILLPVNYCTLNGTDSHDPDGNISGFLWTKIDGPGSFTLINSTAATAQVTNLVSGNYLFELKVTDQGGLMDKDTVQIVVYTAGTGTCNTDNRQQINATLTEIGTLSVARNPAVAAAGNKIVFAGGVSYNNSGDFSGTSAVDIYDITTQSWTTAQLSQARGAIAAVSFGNKIYFAGGSSLSATVDVAYDNIDIYDVSTNTWTVAHLSTPRAEIATAVVGDKIFFAGGTPNWWQGSNRVDIYNTATNQWSTASLSEEKMFVGAVTVGEKVYFAGGENFAITYNTIDIYDNSSNSWSKSSLRELNGATSGVALDGNIYWAGTTWLQNSGFGKVEMWNTNNSSISIECLSYPRGIPTAVLCNKQIAFFAADTYSWGNAVYNRFDIYNTQTKVWSIGLLSQAVVNAAIINVSNTMYMGGGNISATNSTNKVYRLNW